MKMKQLILVKLCYLMLIYGKTTRLASLDEAVQTLANHFCPRTEPFTCDGNTKGVYFSACCSGCSCHESCRLYDNCCFSNRTSDDAIVSCLLTSTKRSHTSGVSLYKFVVKPPPNGCIAPGSCEPPKKRIPWNTFYPVYSDKTKKNYVTHECAKCHGIYDGLHWNSVISLNSVYSYNIEDMLEVLMSGDSDRLYVEFVHPIEGPDRYNDICSDVMADRCYVEPYYKARFFDTMKQVFPNVILRTDEMERLCLVGPKTNFFYNSVSYKNIFCAFCSYVLPTGQCSIFNSKFGDEMSLIKMTDFRLFTNAVSTTMVTSQESYIQKACKNLHGNASFCRSAFCPHLQIRTKNGDCTFAARNWKVDGLQVALRLTTSHYGNIDLSQTFLNLSDSGIKQLFYHNIPWEKEWYIVNIGMRCISSNETGTIEFMLQLANDINHFEPHYVTSSIKFSLQKIWYVRTSIGMLGLQQEFLQYGGGIGDTRVTPNGLFVQPLIYTDTIYIQQDVLEGDLDHEIKNSFETLLSSKPGWYVLDFNPLQRRRVPYLIITKMFYCQQIELQMDEYIILLNGKCLWLKSSKKFYFTGDFSVNIINDESERKVKICVEDTDFSLVSAKGLLVAGNLGIVLCLVPIIHIE